MPPGWTELGVGGGQSLSLRGGQILVGWTELGLQGGQSPASEVDRAWPPGWIELGHPQTRWSLSLLRVHFYFSVSFQSTRQVDFQLMPMFI